MKKIAVNTVKAFLKENKTEDVIVKKYPVGDSEFEVRIRTRLTTDEKALFIRRVMSGCFDQMDNYRPEYFTPMFHATWLQMCSNLPTITLKGEYGPDGESLMDVNAMDELFTVLNLERELNNDKTMFMDLTFDCQEAVEWKKSRILAKDGAPDLSGIDAVGEAADSVKELITRISNVVSGINTEELMQYAGQLSKATEGMDEGGIANGLLRLYKNEH